MRPWKPILLAIIALVLLGNWILTRPDPIPSLPPAAPKIEPAPPPLAPPPAAEPAPITPPPRTEESRAASRRDFENPLVPSSSPAVPPPRKAADAEPDIAADFDQVSLMLRTYRTLTGANPVGTNAEIMKALMGGNPKGAQLGPPEGRGLNEKGELIDRWGTPYFFHQLTADLMEIHSAGPDRRPGTGDDIVSD